MTKLTQFFTRRYSWSIYSIVTTVKFILQRCTLKTFKLSSESMFLISFRCFIASHRRNRRTRRASLLSPERKADACRVLTQKWIHASIGNNIDITHCLLQSFKSAPSCTAPIGWIIHC